jgi:GDP-fucose transporter C1
MTTYSNGPSGAPMSQTLKIALVVIAYFIVSIALVFSNKVLLSSEGATIPAPVFVTWFQCVLTALIIYALGLVAEGTPNEGIMAELPRAKPDYKLSVAKAVLPLSIIFVGMITFNNLCLKYVEVSFYNVARSLTIVINVIFTFFLLGEKTSINTLFCLAVVIVGFFVGSDGEVNFSMIGTIFGVLSSCFVSLNAVFTKKVMGFVDNDKWKLAYYNNVNASLLFLPLIFLTGEHEIIAKYSYLLYSAYFWTMMLIAGVLGFLIGIVTVMQINITSPLTHNISGTAKACVQTVLAYIIWQNDSTLKGNIGVVLVIIGSAVYAYVRMQEMNSAKAAAVSPNSSQYQPVNVQKEVPSATEDSNGNNEPSPIELKKISNAV